MESPTELLSNSKRFSRDSEHHNRNSQRNKRSGDLLGRDLDVYSAGKAVNATIVNCALDFVWGGGTTATDTTVSSGGVQAVLPLALLEPRLTREPLDGRRHIHGGLMELLRRGIPIDWHQQRPSF
jgi:hypothetical protein